MNQFTKILRSSAMNRVRLVQNVGQSKIKFTVVMAGEHRCGASDIKIARRMFAERAEMARDDFRWNAWMNS